HGASAPNRKPRELEIEEELVGCFILASSVATAAGPQCTVCRGRPGSSQQCSSQEGEHQHAVGVKSASPCFSAGSTPVQSQLGAQSAHHRLASTYHGLVQPAGFVCHH
ncbi:hypothetical protein M436DRAFT_54569, partial [Aureobasidium namibiae CBS 147.97]